MAWRELSSERSWWLRWPHLPASLRPHVDLTSPAPDQMSERGPAINLGGQPDSKHHTDSVGVDAPGEKKPAFALPQVSRSTAQESELNGAGTRRSRQDE